MPISREMFNVSESNVKDLINTNTEAIQVLKHISYVANEG